MEADIPYKQILQEIIDILIEGKLLLPKNTNETIKLYDAPRLESIRRNNIYSIS